MHDFLFFFFLILPFYLSYILYKGWEYLSHVPPCDFTKHTLIESGTVMHGIITSNLAETEMNRAKLNGSRHNNPLGFFVLTASMQANIVADMRVSRCSKKGGYEGEERDFYQQCYMTYFTIITIHRHTYFYTFIYNYNTLF